MEHSTCEVLMARLGGNSSHLRVSGSVYSGAVWVVGALNQCGGDGVIAEPEEELGMWSVYLMRISRDLRGLLP